MYFVYIIQSEKYGSFYSGISGNINKRFSEHNSGAVKYTSSKRPYKLIWFCVFGDKKMAFDFEKYLKTGSGIAFRNKHIIKNYHKL